MVKDFTIEPMAKTREGPPPKEVTAGMHTSRRVQFNFGVLQSSGLWIPVQLSKG